MASPSVRERSKAPTVYVIQERLKFPGAWWAPKNAEAMLALPLIRANWEWGAYWRGIVKEAA